MRHWLMKSEPDVFSIDGLAAQPRQTAAWDGVRNYQARNMLRDDMRRGDLAFFYHSSCAVPGVVGIMEITRTAYVDPSQFDPAGPYYDPRSSPDKPRWYMVDVTLVRRFPRIVTLTEMRADPVLSGMLALRRGNRLSITPVTTAEWERVLALAAMCMSGHS
ncbi:MAG TPA: EVE domain-containing protein [Gammaproteobacteria bacterium]|nr:EVE domain-containing protein [Gammaproteobacteria bacterium]